MASQRSNATARRTVLAMIALLVVSPIPSLLAPDRNYTWSLLLFLLPSAAILWWFGRTKDDELAPVKTAFFLTLGLLVPMGLLLNLFFAGHFFHYDNPHAVLGIYVPGLTLHGWDWSLKFPIEEFAFYGFGFVTMLLVYLWADTSFLEREHVRHADYREHGSVIQFAVVPALVALAVIGAGIVYKLLHGGGFPGYLTFLMAIPFVVALTLYRVAEKLVNWPAFALMLLHILGMSVLWEVSLALPGGWWNYRHEQMVGLYIDRWSQLPVEAVLVWFLAAFATAVVFEAAKVFVHHPATVLKQKLFLRPDQVPQPVPAPTPAVEVAP